MKNKAENSTADHPTDDDLALYTFRDQCQIIVLKQLTKTQ
jgi:hypothetical protein